MKNLERCENMRLRNVKNAHERLNNSKYFIKEPTSHKGKWQELFKNNNEVHLEIGTGKGKFLIEMAKKYPNINFIGIEKYESVLLRAVEKMEKLELPNLFFICIDAKNINEIFSKEVSVIYLNFSDPWPKERHKKRRLTSENFLKLYDDIFKDKKIIIQKTDNIKLFAYSLEEFSKYGYTIEKVSLDAEQELVDNVKTEYEEKFSKEGYKINYVKVIK